MKNYQRFAKTFLQLLGSDTATRITSEGFMPLSIEDIGHSPEDLRQIAISHTGVQNGDLMRDPEMVFTHQEIGGITVAEPVSSRNEYMGILQEVYTYNGEGRRTHVNPRLKCELSSFTSNVVPQPEAPGLS